MKHLKYNIQKNYGVYRNTYFYDYFLYCEEKSTLQGISVWKPELSFLLGYQINGISLTWPQGGGTMILNCYSDLVEENLSWKSYNLEIPSISSDEFNLESRKNMNFQLWYSNMYEKDTEMQLKKTCTRPLLFILRG